LDDAVTLTHELGGKLRNHHAAAIPQFKAIYEDRQNLAASLSLTPDDRLAGLRRSSRPESVSVCCGQVGEGVRRIRVRLDLRRDCRGGRCERYLSLHDESAGGIKRAHSRLFAPQMGISRPNSRVGCRAAPVAYLLPPRVVGWLLLGA